MAGVLESVARSVAPSESRSWWSAVSDLTNSTPAGKNVTVDSAVEGTVAVFAAVSLIAETAATLPIKTYRRVDERNRQRVSGQSPEGQMARMVGRSPNPEMTGPEYWENVLGHVKLWGNHFSYVERDGAGQPVGLWPLRPDMMNVFRPDNGRTPTSGRRYVYQLPNGQKVGFGRSEILHVSDFGTDGVKGLSRIAVARNAIGLEQAASEYASRFFSNSAMPSGLLTTEQPLDDTVVERLNRQWQATKGGLTNAQKTAVLHSGIQWQTIGIPPKDAQFLELRRFQIEEIARLYRVPLHLIGDTTKETTWGSGIEQMTIGFVVYCLRPNLKRVEAVLDRDLGDPDAGRTLMDDDVFVEFVVEGLLRGDMDSRSEFYGRGIQDGWLTREDVRARENLPPIDGLDRPVLPMNFAVLDDNGDMPDDVDDRMLAYVRHMRQLQGANDGDH